MTVEVPRPVALKPELTTAAAEPKPPARLCKDEDGAPTICNDQLAEWTAALRAWGRGLAGQLRAIAALQPKEAKP